MNEQQTQKEYLTKFLRVKQSTHTRIKLEAFKHNMYIDDFINWLLDQAK